MSKENNITASKIFPVNVSDLYRAWTNEEALKEWWQPAGRKLTSVKSDLTNGGEITYTFDPLDDSILVITGNYEEVIEEKKLVYTWKWNLNNTPVENGNYKLNVEFISRDNETELNISQESLDQTEGIHPHKEGWDQALNDLETYVTADRE